MLKTLKSYQHLVYLISIWFTRAACNNSVSFLSFNKCAIIHKKKKNQCALIELEDTDTPEQLCQCLHALALLRISHTPGWPAPKFWMGQGFFSLFGFYFV